MATGLEPVFAPGAPVWPLAGAALAALEPDDPDLEIPRGALLSGPREAPERIRIVDQSARLADTPPEPLGVPSTGPANRKRKWTAALVASCVFHAAVALFFIGTNGEEVLMEGAELSGIAFLGDAPEDQLSPGDLAEMDDPNAVDVTMITMLEAKPVETVEAQTVPTAEAVETVEAESPPTETLQPVAEQKLEPVAPTEQPQAPPVEQAETVVTAAAEPPPPAVETPQILATDTVQPVEDGPTVPEVADAVQAEITEPTNATPAKTVPAETAPAETVEPMETATADMVEAEPAESAPDIPLDRIPLPTPRPENKPAEVVKQTEPVQQPAAKPRLAAKTKQTQKPAKVAAEKPAKARRTGNAGKSEADARKGTADGQAEGRTAAKSKGAKNTVAGNAAVSNYPGKVASKLRRALRYPAEAKRQKLRGQAQVSFVVSAGGGVGSIRVVSSSGSPILDKAAIETVRRAAPFPAIPAAAARSSWPFTVPLAFNR